MVGPRKIPLHVFAFAFVFGSTGNDGVTLPGCSVRPELEISNVNIIDVTTGVIHSNATLEIGKGCICQIGATGQHAQRAVRRIDGRGRYALPGLWTASVMNERDRLAGYGITNVTGTPTGSLPDGADLFEQLSKR